MQLFSTEMRNWWKQWELQLIVLFSALLQVILVIWGSRRKFTCSPTQKAFVWSTYLTSDSVATLALGVLSNKLANIKETTRKLDPNDQLTAFWAPFLLLHLGGPDTITAYALEDNELWLRHLARLVVQTGLTCYIYFLALTGSALSILASAMIAVGFIKYAERTLSLYLASKDRLRDSMLSPPKLGPVYPQVMEQYSLRREEGYGMAVDEVIEVQASEDLSIDGDVYDEKASDLLKASSLFEIFKILFVDLILSFSDLGSSISIFMNLAPEKAFRIIEIELSFMYDLLYTKGIILYSRWGVFRRIVTLCLTCGVLVFFSMAEWKNYTKANINITFSLLGVAILLEIYCILLTISSDQARVWALRNQNQLAAKVINSLWFCHQPRWSNAVGQFSLLHLSLRNTPGILRNVPKLAKFDENLQKYRYISYKPFQNNMKEWIYEHLKNKDTDLKKKYDEHLKKKGKQLKHSNPGGTDVKIVSSGYEAGRILEKNNEHDMTWSIENIEFDQSILIWHIATELCYYYDREKMIGKCGEPMTNYKLSKVVSRYMLYLLVMHPFMLPTGISQLRYADTSLEARKYFIDMRSKLKNQNRTACWARIRSLVTGKWKGKDEKKCPCSQQALHKLAKSTVVCQACHWLLDVETVLPPGITIGGKSKSVLFDACILASQLRKIVGGPVKRWKLISEIWREALLYAACHCEGDKHAERLSKGGEPLSHVWLLMAHFGISEQVRITEAPAMAKLLKK